MLNKQKYNIWNKLIVMVIVCLMMANDLSFAITQTHRSALAQPLAMKPPCEIVYNEITGSFNIITNDDVIAFWDKENAKNINPNDTFRRKWAFVDLSYAIADMLQVTVERNIKNPKEILIPLIKKHIKKRNGEDQVLLEGYDINGIEELRDSNKVTAFILPIKRNGKYAFDLVYNMKSGSEIPRQSGIKIYVNIESAELTSTDLAVQADNPAGLGKVNEETKPVTVSDVLKLLEENADEINGLSIPKAAKVMGINSVRLYRHLKRYPDNVKKYGLLRRKLAPNINGISTKEIQGLSVSQIAEKYGVAASTIYRQIDDLLVFAKERGILIFSKHNWDTREKAVQNILKTIKKERSDIIGRYRRLKNLTEAEVRLLREDIYALKEGHFTIWGLGSVIFRRDVKYFKGSHIEALMQVFPALNLNRLGFQLQWTTAEQRAASVRYAVGKEFPDLIKRYDELDVNDPEAVRAIQNEFYKIGSFHFSVLGLQQAWKKEVSPEFGGRYGQALKVVFPKAKLNLLGFELDWSSLNKAIESLLYVLSRERPDIIDRYNRIESLDPEEVKTLKKDITSIKYAHFSAWGLHYIFLKKTKHLFNGKVSKALMTVLTHQKLALKEGDFQKHAPKKYRWKDGIDVCKANILDAIGNHNPDIIKRYEMLRDLSPRQIKELREEIYEIRLGHFMAYGLSTVVKANIFNGNYKDALIAALPELKLERLGFELEWSSRSKRIESAIYVLTRKIPEIMDRYNKLAELNDREIEALKRDIYRISQGYIRLWGLSTALDRTTSPEFEGSYIKLMLTVFKDLNLDPLGFQLDWKTEARANASIRYVVFREVPKIKGLYENISKLGDNEIETLKNEIYRVSFFHLMLWGLSNAVHKNKVAFYDGSYIKLLIKAFQHPRLHLVADGFVKGALIRANVDLKDLSIPEDIAEEYLPLMQQVSAEIVRKRKGKDDPFVYLSGALKGLIETYNKYPISHPGFRNLARNRMKQRIMDQIRDENELSRSQIDYIRKLYRAEEALFKKGISVPSLEELAEESGIPKAKIQNLQSHKKALLFSVLNSENEDDRKIETSIPAEKAEKTFVQEKARGQVQELLEVHGRRLNSIEYEVLKRYYTDEDHPSMKEIGEKLHLSESRISQIHAAAIDKLKKSVSLKRSQGSGKHAPDKPSAPKTTAVIAVKAEGKKTKKNIDPNAERIHTVNFQDAVKYLENKEVKRAEAANEAERPLIVALGKSWIKGYRRGECRQYDALNPLLTVLRSSRKFNGAQFIIEEDGDLLGKINAKMKEKGFENARVIALAGENTITGELADLNKGANVLMGVDNTNLDEMGYIRIMEMLKIAARLAIDPEAVPASPNMLIEKRGGFWIFIPNEKPMDYERLKDIYEFQRSA